MITEIFELIDNVLQFLWGIVTPSPYVGIPTMDLVHAPMPDIPVQQAWIGAAISAATTIAGMISNSRTAHKEAEEQEAAINKQQAEAAALYRRRMNEDGTQRATVRNAITKGVEGMRRGVQAVEGTNAVMGGTNAKAAAEKESVNETQGNMIAQAAIAGDARKDAVEDRYANQQQDITKQQMNLNAQRSQAKQANVTAAVNGVNQVVSSYEASNYDHGVAKPTEKERP